MFMLVRCTEWCGTDVLIRTKRSSDLSAAGWNVDVHNATVRAFGPIQLDKQLLHIHQLTMFYIKTLP